MGALDELNIIKDHIHFRIIRRTRPLTIHTECLHKDNVWKAAQRFVNSGGKAIWHVATPVNFDFVKAESGCNLSLDAWKRRILERYRWLQKHGQQIDVHVHLRVKMELYDSNAECNKDIEGKVAGAVSWLRKNGFSPKEIAFGWWSYNDFAVDVARRHGLRTVETLDYYFIHDYDLLCNKA